MTDTDIRMACPTPAKKRYSTPEAADLDRIKLASKLGRNLETYDDCPCGWIHLATAQEMTGLGSEPMTTETILALSHDDFNTLVRRDVRGAVHPDTARALRHPRLAHAWLEALKLFRFDLNIQRQARSADRSQGAAEWLRRLSRVMLSAADRLTEAQRLVRDVSHLKTVKLPQSAHTKTNVGCLTVEMPTASQLDEKILRRVAGDLAAEKLKNEHLDRYIYLCALEYQRLGLPLTKAMQITLAHHEATEPPTGTEENE